MHHLSLLTLLLLPFTILAHQSPQIPLMPPPDAFEPLTHAVPTLADTLTIQPSASIFYSYARELPLSSLLSDSSRNLTLLVPTNKAVMALARKPHQGPVADEGIDIVISEEEFDERSRENVERWVRAHIIPQSGIPLLSQTYTTLLPGKSITFRPLTPKENGQGPEWTRVTLEDGIRILDKKEAANGDMYLIDGTVSVPVDSE